MGAMAFYQGTILCFVMTTFNFLPMTYSDSSLRKSAVCAFANSAITSFYRGAPRLSVFCRLLVHARAAPLLGICNRCAYFTPAGRTVRACLGRGKGSLASVSHRSVVGIICGDVVHKSNERCVARRFRGNTLNVPSVSSHAVAISFSMDSAKRHRV